MMYAKDLIGCSNRLLIVLFAKSHLAAKPVLASISTTTIPTIGGPIIEAARSNARRSIGIVKVSASVKRSPKTAPSSTGLARIRGKVRPSVTHTAEDLAVEFYTLVGLALGELGVTRKQQRRALERSRRLKTPPNVSGRILRAQLGVAEILLEWSRKSPYLDSEGKPRVLAIAGPGATFESLAQRFLPNLSLAEVVALACENSEVITRPGHRIALLGSILVKLGDSREKYFAHAIRQIDQLLQTLLHNWRVHGNRDEQSRMERVVIGVISQANFDAFMAELRPQIYDLLLRVDSSIERNQPRTARALRASTAVSVSVYVGQQNDLDRAGVDTSPVTLAERRGKLKKRSTVLTP
jgi:hypothetical protein